MHHTGSKLGKYQASQSNNVQWNSDNIQYKECFATKMLAVDGYSIAIHTWYEGDLISVPVLHQNCIYSGKSLYRTPAFLKNYVHYRKVSAIQR